jgi:hypothetical protein
LSLADGKLKLAAAACTLVAVVGGSPVHSLDPRACRC